MLAFRGQVDKSAYLPKVGDVVQCLQQRIHVAGGALEVESYKACLVLAVMHDVIKLHLDQHLHMQGQPVEGDTTRLLGLATACKRCCAGCTAKASQIKGDLQSTWLSRVLPAVKLL